MKQASPHMRFGVGQDEPMWAAIACSTNRCHDTVNRILSARLSLVDATTRMKNSHALNLDSETFVHVSTLPFEAKTSCGGVITPKFGYTNADRD
jgi:hypothetical protein